MQHSPYEPVSVQHDHAPQTAQPHIHNHALAHVHLAHVHLAPFAIHPGFSLLRLSAWQRLGGAGLVNSLLWVAVFWALRP